MERTPSRQTYCKSCSQSQRAISTAGQKTTIVSSAEYVHGVYGVTREPLAEIIDLVRGTKAKAPSGREAGRGIKPGGPP